MRTNFGRMRPKPSCFQVGAWALGAPTSTNPTHGVRASLQTGFVQRAPAWGAFLWRHRKPGIDLPRRSGEIPTAKSSTMNGPIDTSERACRSEIEETMPK